MVLADRAGDNSCMRPRRKQSSRPPRRILVLDIGGSHVKFRIGRGKVQRFESGPGMTPAVMCVRVLSQLKNSVYDAVSAGYPGLVLHGRIATEPHNLAPGWVHFDFQHVLKAPVRIVNDAAMQAIGSYAGGRMLFMGLGTGLGVTAIMDGVVEPMEIAHMPFRHGRTYEDYVGERGRKRLGTHKWRKVVREVVEQLTQVLEADYVVIGGGNARRLKSLPDRARLGDNANAFRGGLRLWKCGVNPLTVPM